MHFVVDRDLFDHVLADHLGPVSSVLHFHFLRLFGRFAVYHPDVFVEHVAARGVVLLHRQWAAAASRHQAVQNGKGPICAVPFGRNRDLPIQTVLGDLEIGGSVQNHASTFFDRSMLCELDRIEPLWHFGRARHSIQSAECTQQRVRGQFTGTFDGPFHFGGHQNLLSRRGAG